MLRKDNAAPMGGICAVIATKNTSEKKKAMAKVNVTATINIQRTKTIEVDVRVNDVKEWLRDNYGTPSEHGMSWDDPEVLAEFLPDVHQDLDFDEEEGSIDETENDQWEIDHVERFQ